MEPTDPIPDPPYEIHDNLDGVLSVTVNRPLSVREALQLSAALATSACVVGRSHEDATAILR